MTKSSRAAASGAMTTRRIVEKAIESAKSDPKPTSAYPPPTHKK